MKMLARYLNILLGVWLVISAFVWSHEANQYTNAWVVGALAVIVALVGTVRQEARFLNALLAVWLFASIWVLPGVASTATQWNSALVAIALFVFAMLPNSFGMAGRGIRTPSPGRA